MLGGLSAATRHGLTGWQRDVVTVYVDAADPSRGTIQVAPGASTEVMIAFKGSVPEIDREETSLTTHVVKQVSAALRSQCSNCGPMMPVWSAFAVQSAPSPSAIATGCRPIGIRAAGPFVNVAVSDTESAAEPTPHKLLRPL